MVASLNIELHSRQILMAVAGATALATLTGGFAALWLSKHIHHFLGFSAGAIVAVALLDLIPEALKAGLGSFDPKTLTTFTGLGFMACFGVDRWLGAGDRPSTARGHFGAGSLTLHSLLDGVAIGSAFQASQEVGVLVAAAVLTHDVADAVNTVSLGLAGANVRVARGWLIADALAPGLGILVTQLFPFPSMLLAPVLATVAGTFLYIGAGRLAAETAARTARPWAVLTALCGFGLIYIVAANAK